MGDQCNKVKIELRSQFLTYKAIGKELVDRSKGKACDWSSGVLRADDFEEGPQENIGLNI